MRRNLPLTRVLPPIVLSAAVLALTASAFEIEQLTCLPPECIPQGGHLLTGDGQRVLFRSGCDLDAGRNPDRTAQVFLLDLNTRQIDQLTPPAIDWAKKRGLPCSFEVTADGSGQRIVIAAACGGEVPGDFRTQLVESRGEPGVLDPIGPPVPCGMEPSLSADGQHLAVSSDCHPARRARGRREKFVFRSKLYLQDAPGGRFKRFGRRAKGCRVTDPHLSSDGRVALVSSECALAPRSNPDKRFQIFRVDRPLAIVERVNPMDCIVSAGGPTPLFVMDPPALSADGQVAAFTARECGTRDDWHVFRRRAGGNLEQLTSGFCATRERGPETLGTLTYPPVAISGDGRTVAFGVRCVEAPVFGDQTDHLFVHRDDSTPNVVELFSQSSTQDRSISEPSMDLAGRSLVLTAPFNPGGCPSGGGNQLYLVRNLQDPAPGPSTCACGPPMR